MEYDVDKIIDALGGTNRVARLFGIKSASVSEWRSRKEIPKARLQYLQAVYPGAFAGQSLPPAKKAPRKRPRATSAPGKIAA